MNSLVMKILFGFYSSEKSHYSQEYFSFLFEDSGLVILNMLFTTVIMRFNSLLVYMHLIQIE